MKSSDIIPVYDASKRKLIEWFRPMVEYDSEYEIDIHASADEPWWAVLDVATWAVTGKSVGQWLAKGEDKLFDFLRTPKGDAVILGWPAIFMTKLREQYDNKEPSAPSTYATGYAQTALLSGHVRATIEAVKPQLVTHLSRAGRLRDLLLTTTAPSDPHTFAKWVISAANLCAMSVEDFLIARQQLGH